MSKNITVSWEGALFEEQSLAMVNGHIISRLQKDNRFQWRLIQPEKHAITTYETNRTKQVEKSPDIYISHKWPPRMERPNGNSLWISILPWEFGAIPVAWYVPMKYNMQEIWVYSQYNKEHYVRSGLPEEKIKVIPLGIDDRVFHPDVMPTYFEGDDRFRFLYVGGTIARKGFDLLLDAYLSEFNKEDSVCLIIKDHGTNAHYRGITMEQRIREVQADPEAPAIEYIDQHLSPHQLAALYRSCHCSVFPYRGEGFGLPIAESAACGIPVIVPELGPSVEMLNEDHALFIQAKEQKQKKRKVGELETIDFPSWIEPDLKDLREKMRFALNHKEKIDEIGKRACQHIHSHFTWDRTAKVVAKNLEAAYQERKIQRYHAEDIIKEEINEAKQELEHNRVEQALGKTQALLHVFPDDLTVRLNAAHLFVKQEKHLQAIGILVPMTKELENKEGTWNDWLYTHVWSLLAISYCGIHSWSLAMDAFRKAGEGNLDVNTLKIPYLHKAIRSLELLIGSIHQELGDAYLALDVESKSLEMYDKALGYNSKLEEVKQRQKLLEKRRLERKQKMKPLLDFSYQLLHTANSSPSVRWIASGGTTYSHDFFFERKQWNSFFLPGQYVCILNMDDVHFEKSLQEHDRTGKAKWDGAIIMMTKHHPHERCIQLVKWCSNNVKHGGKVIVHSSDEENQTYLAVKALLEYSEWCKTNQRTDNNAYNGVYAIFQMRGFGVLWQSPLYNDSGYATEQQHFLQSLKRYPLLIQLKALDAPKHPPDSSTGHRRSENYLALRESPIVHYQAAPAYLMTLPKAPLSIGRTMFETDRLPEDWVRNLNELTEVWVPSSFNKETFANCGVKEERIHIVPGAIDGDKYNPLRAKPYSLPKARRYKILSIFDWSIRKGWDVLLKAYLETFTDEDDVTLVLKVSKINEPSAQVNQIVEQMIKNYSIKRPAHMMIIDSRMTEEEMIGLYVACDVFVLPTRGEGWGRPFMEAMALEIPVIATGWSGHLEFMNEENSYLIDVERMVPVPESMPAHFHGHKWAEPSIEHLKMLLKNVYQNQNQAKQKGKKAREDLFPRFSTDEVGRLFYRRLDALIRNYLQ